MRRGAQGFTAAVLVVLSACTAPNPDYHGDRPDLAVDLGGSDEEGDDLATPPDLLPPPDLKGDLGPQCGIAGTPCCSGNCGASAVCVGGFCQPCGNANELCCQGGGCTDGYLCSLGFCAPCGTLGRMCCASSRCAAGTACAGGFCQTCGDSGQPCCDGATCPASKRHACLPNDTCS